MATPRSIAEPKAFPVSSMERTVAQILKDQNMLEGILQIGSLVTHSKIGLKTSIHVDGGQLFVNCLRTSEKDSAFETQYTFQILECGKLTELQSIVIRIEGQWAVQPDQLQLL